MWAAINRPTQEYETTEATDYGEQTGDYGVVMITKYFIVYGLQLVIICIIKFPGILKR